MLRDRFGRSIEYLRLSVTDRCDLRCTYCLPKGFKGFEEPQHWLTFDEIERLLAAFARLGTSRIRLTGGEPLLRRNLPELAARIAALPGIRDLSLSTNATRLHRYAPELKAAGVSRINVSLDSLDRGCMEKITGSDSLNKIMDGIMAGKAAGFAPIKINMVAMRGVNEDEIDDMVAILHRKRFHPAPDRGDADGRHRAQYRVSRSGTDSVPPAAKIQFAAAGNRTGRRAGALSGDC